MFLWILLLPILASRGAQSGAVSKAVVLLQPSWSPNFQGESVTLTCKEGHSAALGNTVWYYEGNLWQIKSGTIATRKAGKYQCETRGFSRSDPVDVVFSPDWLILQASYPIFEGDNVNIRCQGKDNNKITERIYYKDGKELDLYKNKKLITLSAVFKDNSEYHCTASGRSILKWTEHSNHLRIQVQELFPPPNLTVIPSKPTEGNPMTLRCETWLPPQKSHIQLQFCFFREGHILETSDSRSPELQIPIIWSEDSGFYWCETKQVARRVRKQSIQSQIHVQRIPVSNVNLELRPPGGQMIEGEDLVLVCSVAKGSGTITFSWHREGIVSLGRKTERSLMAELRVPNVKERDAGRYYCTADNIHGPIISKWIEVTVRVPVSHIILTLRTQRAQPVVGDMMELHCEAKQGSPPILYRFYWEDVILGNSSGSSGGVSFNISLTTEHSGNYSCEASNDLRAQHSHRMTLNVIIPVSRPVLTLRDSKAQTVVGDVVEFLCEAKEGSPPILYQFYHKDIILGRSSVPSGGASFNFSVTTEHSGNYSCEASNGLEAQHSEVVALNVIGPSSYRAGLIAARITGGLLSILGLAATAALWYHFRTQRKSGEIATPGTPSNGPNESLEPSLSRSYNTNSQEPSYSESLALVELQPVYSNVNPGTNLVYSQIMGTRNAKENSAVNSSRVHQEDKKSTVLYLEVKKAHPEQAYSTEKENEDDTENYENVPCTSSASQH